MTPWDQVKATALALAEAALAAVRFEVEARRAASEIPAPALEPEPEPDEAEQLALEFDLDVAEVRAVLNISDAQIVRTVARYTICQLVRIDLRDQHLRGPIGYAIRPHREVVWQLVTPRGEFAIPFRTSVAAINAAWSLYAKDLEEEGET